MGALEDFVGSIITAGGSPSAWAVGTVTAVTAGAALDGNALVTVSWQGTAVRCAYGAHYTPTVNDVVLMARVGPQLAIVCRLIGTPPNS